MTTKMEFFSKEEDLQRLTRLNHDQLWEVGFNLDDWDWGIRTRCDLEKSKFHLLLHWMDNYCCGYELVKHDGYNYYLLYHA